MCDQVENNQTKSNKKIILGLDIGTSSVKCSIVQCAPTKYQILAESKFAYDPARIKSSQHDSIPASYSQQNVGEIVRAIRCAITDCVETFFSNFSPCKREIDLISICGQEHGVVLWNHRDYVRSSSENFDFDFDAISDHYDWRDGRCDTPFLDSLPTPQSYANRIHTGFGCCTLFWLSRHRLDILRRYDRAGTIMDFFAATICGSNEVCISAQNAFTWGYYDPRNRCWNKELLEKSGFPIALLPKPVPLNTVIGRSIGFKYFFSPSTSASSSTSIVERLQNIPVMVAYGDLQAITHCAMLNPDPDPNPNLDHSLHNSLLLNIGTSIQLVRYECDRFEPPQKSISQIHLPAIDYYPQTETQYMAVAAGLNGGNVLRCYAQFLRDTVRTLTGESQTITEDDVWRRLTALDEDYFEPQNVPKSLLVIGDVDRGKNCEIRTKNNSFQKNVENDAKNNERNDFFRITPTLFAERHKTDTYCTITDLRFAAPDLPQLTRRLCRSILDNIFSMATGNADADNDTIFGTPLSTSPIRTLICAGSVLQRNSILRRSLLAMIDERRLPGLRTIERIRFVPMCDADVGAALFAFDQMYKNQI